jgi:hypothetical protein
LIGGSGLGAANQNDPAILQRYPVSLLTSNISSPAARAAGIPSPYAGFNGTVAQALRPFPQYQAVNRQNSANGSSTYNALQVRLEKRYTNGLQARIAYTWSKFINNGAEGGLAGIQPGIPQSVFIREKSLSVDNIPQSLIISYSYELPFGRGKRFLNNPGVTNWILGGWNLSAIHRYDSGRPLSITMNNIYGGILFNPAMRPDRVAGVSGYANRDNSNFDITKDRYLSTAGFANPPDGRLGNESKVDSVIRGWANYNEDFSVFKGLPIREWLNGRLGANFANIFNRHVWCDANTNFSDGANFGLVSGQCNYPRRIEGYIRFQF